MSDKTEQKILNITYLDGSTEELTVWDRECDPEEFDIRPEFFEGWADDGFEVYGLDAEFNDCLFLRLDQVRRLISRRVQPQDAVLALVPPIEQRSYDLRHF